MTYFLKDLFLFMCVFSICACMYGVEGARGSQKILGSLELELHAVVSLLICVLGTELTLSETAGSVLNSSAISSPPS